MIFKKAENVSTSKIICSKNNFKIYSYKKKDFSNSK